MSITKNASAHDVIAALKKYDMQGHVVVYGNYNYLKAIHAAAPTIKVMPEAYKSEILTQLLQAFQPKVIAYTDADFDNPTIRLAKAAGAEIFVDRMGPQDSPDFWLDAVERGPPESRPTFPLT